MNEFSGWPAFVAFLLVLIVPVIVSATTAMAQRRHAKEDERIAVRRQVLSDYQDALLRVTVVRFDALHLTGEELAARPDDFDFNAEAVTIARFRAARVGDPGLMELVLGFREEALPSLEEFDEILKRVTVLFDDLYQSRSWFSRLIS